MFRLVASCRASGDWRRLFVELHQSTRYTTSIRDPARWNARGESSPMLNTTCRGALLAFVVFGCLQPGIQAGGPPPAPSPLGRLPVQTSASRAADPAHRALLDR